MCGATFHVGASQTAGDTRDAGRSRRLRLALESVDDLRNGLRISLIQVARLAHIVAVDEVLEAGEIGHRRLRRILRQFGESLERLAEARPVPEKLEVRIHRAVE